MLLALEDTNHSDHTSLLRASKKAPVVLSKPSPAGQIFPLSLLSTSEKPETWTEYERLFLACLKTGDDQAAHLALERLTQRFGADNERVMGLRGLYQEAVADRAAGLERLLDEYGKILGINPMNVPILKRRIAIKRLLQEPQEAITLLVDFLESTPTDAEAWCELADLYQSQGMSPQAIFSLEEALLIVPYAWNLHARMGEIEFVAASSGFEGTETVQSLLADSVQRFSRSIELCDGYLRGYYGLKLASNKLLQILPPSKSHPGEAQPRQVIERLHEMATRKLEQLVKTWSRTGSSHLKKSEIMAAKTLLDRFNEHEA